MHSVNIPITPLWNLTSGSVSTPDDGFLYIGLKVINYISKIGPENPIVKSFHTRQLVKSIDCDSDWSATKYFAALTEDNSIQVWDFSGDRALYGHSAHVRVSQGDGDWPGLDKVQLCFLQNRNILSIDSSALVRFCVSSNTFCKSKRIIPKKHSISIIKGSPYDKDIFAAGSSRGIVLVANLKSETVLYSLSSHNTEITSLSWTQLNSSVINFVEVSEVRPKLKAKKSVPVLSNDDIFDIYDYDYLENEFGAPVKPSKLPLNDGEDCYVGMEKPKDNDPNVNFNFVEACQHLKEEIGALQTEKEPENSSKVVTLQDCQNAVPVGHSSPSCPSDHSLQIIECSSDECDTEDHKVVHQAEIHRTDESAAKVSPDVTKFEITVLSSGDQEGHVWIWNTNAGYAIDKIYLRSNSSHSNNAAINVAWINSATLMTNNKNGALALWNLIPASADQKATFKQDKRGFNSHNGVMTFCKAFQSETIWSISCHREIVCESIFENKILAKFSCASTNIAAIRERRDDMNKLALACADRRIGIMNISNISPKNIAIDSYSKNIDGSVLALVWCPNDRFLAFGTASGRVGIIDTEKPNNACIMDPFCGKPIYSMDWKGDYIYACCTERVALYRGDMKNKEPIILNGITDISEISVKDELLFVGTQSGFIEVYEESSSKADYNLIKKIAVSRKYISEINWNPIQTDRFIVSSLAPKIKIFSWNNQRQSKLEHELECPGTACVKWSNRNENLFLSCGFDGSVRIWNLTKKDEELVFLKQFHCPMFCGLFSPIDDNIIICAGKSTTVEMFDMRVERCDKDSNKFWNDTKKLGVLLWARKVDCVGSATNTKKKRRNKEHRGSHSFDGTAGVTEMLEDLTIEKDKFEKLPENEDFLKVHSTILHLTTREGNKDTLEHLKCILENDSKSNVISRKLFGSRTDVEKLLNAELLNHQASQTNSIATVLIPQINGNLKEEIIMCVQNKKLTEWHISLAPTISYDFWKKCCEAYSKQLLEQGLILQAATYMLALHKIRDIIQCLLEQHFFKEAWIFGKVYLESEDPTLATILDSWIAYLDLNGHLEGAAFVCALSGQLEMCRDILNKRRKPTDDHAYILNLIDQKLSSVVLN